MGEHRGPLSEPTQVETDFDGTVLGLVLTIVVLFGIILVIIIGSGVYRYRKWRDRRNEVPNERDPLLRDGHQPVNGPQAGARDRPRDGQQPINEVGSSDEEEDEFISFPRDNQ
jgi:hypothetical protein